MFQWLRTRGRQAAKPDRSLGRGLLQCRDLYARAYVEYTRLRNMRRHSAPIDPYRLYWIDPDQIEHSTSWHHLKTSQYEQTDARMHPPHYRLAGQVMAGDWDLNLSRFTDSVVYTSFEAHFNEDVSWGETELFSQCLEAIERGENPWGCSALPDLQRRFDAVDQLYDRMARDGYRIQDELIENNRPDPIGSARSNTYSRRIEGEIAVNIGYLGDVLFYDGRNRLAIAKLLDIETIPVVILVRHRNWQRLRDAVATGNKHIADLPESLQNHPDMIDLY